MSDFYQTKGTVTEDEMRVRKLPESEDFPGVLVGATIGSPSAVRIPANRQFINMTRKTVDPKNAQFLIESSNISTLFLAEILGVTPDAITKLHSARVMRQNGKSRGKYSLFDAAAVCRAASAPNPNSKRFACSHRGAAA